jgi:hypothetical protein
MSAKLLNMAVWIFIARITMHSKDEQLLLCKNVEYPSLRLQSMAERTCWIWRYGHCQNDDALEGCFCAETLEYAPLPPQSIAERKPARSGSSITIYQ